MDEHREKKLWGTLIFRSANKRECKRENAAEVRVKGRFYTDDIWWPWPQSENVIKMIDQVASAAYEVGRGDMRGDIRDVLGIKESTDYDGVTTVSLE